MTKWRSLKKGQKKKGGHPWQGWKNERDVYKVKDKIPLKDLDNLETRNHVIDDDDLKEWYDYE